MEDLVPVVVAMMVVMAAVVCVSVAGIAEVWRDVEIARAQAADCTTAVQVEEES